MKRKSSWSGGWSGGGSGEENEDNVFSFTSTGAAPSPGYAALTRPTILSKEAYIYSEEDDGTESWKLSQYGFKLQETEAAENTIEWRTGDTMRVSMREGYADQVTQFWFETIGRAAVDDYTVAEFAVKNSDVINSSYSRVTWAGYAVHDGAPYFYVQLRRGTASAANAWYATHDGTLKQAWFGATPVAKAGATSDIKDALVNYGLLTDGGATPLNLDGGTLTVGALSGSTLTASTAFVGPIWRPASDSTSALKIQNAAGTTDIVTIDTTNNSIGINAAPVATVGLWLSKVATTTVTPVGIRYTAARQNTTYVIGSQSVIAVDTQPQALGTVSTTKAAALIGLQVGATVQAESGITTTVTNIYSINVTAPTISGSGTKTITNSYGAFISNQGNSSTTSAYGIWISTQTGSTNNYALITNGGAVILNEDGTDSDTRFEGDTDANCFFLDASTDRIGIGTNAPGYKLDVAGGINVSSGNVYRVNGTQVLAAQGAAVADASGGATIDAEARTALNALLARLRTHGMIAT